MEKEIIIDVDKYHRIKVYNKFSTDSWVWFVEKQVPLIFSWWGCSNWGGGGLLMRIPGFSSRTKALEYAEGLRRSYLNIEE